MHNNKKIIGLLVLTLLTLITNMSWGDDKNTKKETYYLTQSNKKKLWDILYKTGLEKIIAEQTLKDYAETIKQLCIESPDILNEKFENDPLEYSLSHCHEQIDAALIAAKQLLTGGPVHPSRSPEQKKLAEEYAQKTSKTLALNIKKLVPSKFFTDTNFIGTDTVKLKTVNDGLNWQFTYKTNKDRVFLITALETASQKKVGYIECAFKIEDDEKTLNINDLSVSETKRLGGLGKTMLLTAIELAKSFYPDSKITLYSLADDDAIRIVLIRYYKAFGFVPDKTDPANMTMYIKNGKVLKPYELAV